MNINNSINEVHACIESKLCSQLGNIKKVDFVRAKMNKHNFKESSAFSKVLAEKFPNFHFSNPHNKNENSFTVRYIKKKNKILNFIAFILFFRSQ